MRDGKGSPSPASEPELCPDNADTGLLCLSLMLRFHGLAVDAKALSHRFASGAHGLSEVDLLRAAREFGLRCRWIASRWDRLAKTPLPAIAATGDGKFLILAKVAAAEGKVLIHDPVENRPVTLDLAAFEQLWSGRLLLMTKRASLSETFAKFDIAWFVPAILKYKRILIEVLVASFVLQLFALVTPLFFQVIIDKVVVGKATQCSTHSSVDGMGRTRPADHCDMGAAQYAEMSSESSTSMVLGLSIGLSVGLCAVGTCIVLIVVMSVRCPTGL